MFASPRLKMCTASPWEGFVLGGDPASGPVAVGGQLDPATMIGAYRIGVFPWPTSDASLLQELYKQYGASIRSGHIPNLTPERQPSLEIPWWSPDPRGVLLLDAVHISGSLRRCLRHCGWTTTLDVCFEKVVENCVRGEIMRWITPEMIAAYTKLHHLGHAHSIEVWEGEELIGGMYGVVTGRVFTGESMFFLRANASKVALVDFADRLREAGGLMIDTQTSSEHFKSMGAQEMPRAQFLEILAAVRDKGVRIRMDRLDVSRLT